MDEIKKIWPQWTTEELIGRGSYGKVYKVRREENGYISHAAVKIIQIPQDESEVRELMSSGMDYASIHSFFKDMIHGLEDEIRVMEKLKTAQNIVSIENYHFVEHEEELGWTIYIQMELLESLNRYLLVDQKEMRRMSSKEVAKLGLDICSALECCEKEQIIHRDVKPDNIFRNKYGTYKLGDFGVARQMEKTKGSMSQKGTSMYMAPEVYMGSKYDHTVDIYSLGITMYKLLNGGRFPFYPTDRMIRPGDSDMAMTKRIRGDQMDVPMHAEKTLANIILKACAFQPDERYESASDMKQELEKWLFQEKYGIISVDEFDKKEADSISENKMLNTDDKLEFDKVQEEGVQTSEEYVSLDDEDEKTWNVFSAFVKDKATEEKKEEMFAEVLKVDVKPDSDVNDNKKKIIQEEYIVKEVKKESGVQSRKDKKKVKDIKVKPIKKTEKNPVERNVIRERKITQNGDEQIGIMPKIISIIIAYMVIILKGYSFWNTVGYVLPIIIIASIILLPILIVSVFIGTRTLSKKQIIYFTIILIFCGIVFLFLFERPLHEFFRQNGVLNDLQWALMKMF